MPLLHIHDASMSDSLKLHKPWALHTHRPRSQELSPDTSGWEGAWKNQFTSHRDRRSRRHESLPTPLLYKVWQLLKPKHSSDSEASVDVPQGCFHPLCALQMAVLRHSSHFKPFTLLFSTCNAVTLCGGVLHLPQTPTQKARPRLLLSGGLHQYTTFTHLSLLSAPPHVEIPVLCTCSALDLTEHPYIFGKGVEFFSFWFLLDLT